MKLNNFSQNISLPLRLTGHVLLLLFSALIYPFIPLAIWAIIQAEMNRHKTKYMRKLNNWAVSNPDTAKLYDIEPNYTAALNVGGLAGLYLNVTKYNAEPLLEKYARNGNKITPETPNLSNWEIELLIKKIKQFNTANIVGGVIMVLFVIFLFLLMLI